MGKKGRKFGSGDGDWSWVKGTADKSQSAETRVRNRYEGAEELEERICGTELIKGTQESDQGCSESLEEKVRRLARRTEGLENDRMRERG